MTAFVVAGKIRWPDLRDELELIFPQMTLVHALSPGEAAQQVRAALKEGYLEVVAVGDDGHINAVLNGFFESGVAVSPDAVLSFIAEGGRADIARDFGIAPGHEAGLSFLRRARIRRADVGLLQCLDVHGEPAYRFFLGAASLGFGATVAKAAEASRLSRLFGRGLAGLHRSLALARWRGCRVRLMADTGYDEISGISSVVLGNGGWFDDALHVAPRADPQDGQFDVVVLPGGGRRQLQAGLARVRAGTHLSDPAVRAFRAGRVTAVPVLETLGQVGVECDGAYAGILPATFEVLPGAINLRC